MPTQAVFYRDADGREPVREFLRERMTAREREIVGGQIDELNGLARQAPPVAFPLTSQIDGPLRELRCHHGRALYRILYRRSGNLFVLLHMIAKRSRTVPRQDIALAQRRWADFKQRMDTADRRGPRPLGKDAP